jgi:hypothetical protein
MRYWRLATAELIDDFRYLLMRIARLCCLLLFEIGFIVCLLEMFRYLMPAFFFAIEEVQWWFAGLFFVLTALCFCMSLATSIPYRYKSWKPGINPRTCSRCGIQIADDWFCSGCKTFRLAKVGSSVILASSVLVTVAFVTHDVIAIALSSALRGGPSK